MGEEDALAGIADELYALPAAEFTAARDRVARDCADKALAERIRRLRKPTVAAAAINMLVRRESGRIEEVFALAASLRDAAAAMDGEELRALTRQRRQLTHALASAARAHAHEEGVRLTDATTEQVEQMLNAAMLDPAAADVLRTGLVLAGFTSSGVGELDGAAVLAVPSAAGARARPAPAREAGLRAVPDTDEIRRARLDEAVTTAQEALAGAEREHADAVRVAADADAERLRVADELDSARRRVADLEDELDRVDAAAAEAVEARGLAEQVVGDARATLEAARHARGRAGERPAGESCRNTR